jgi:hypothetical protein
MKRIAIHSVPRSGSTWLGCIFDSSPGVKYAYQPLFSYEFKGRLDEDSSKLDIVNFFKEIGNSKDAFINQTQSKKEGTIPSFPKSKVIHSTVYKEVRYHYILRNMLETDDQIRVIGLIRNPLGVINSWLKAPKEFRANLGWIEEEEWRHAHQKNSGKREEYNGYYKWKEVTMLFEGLKNEFPSRFYLLKYEDLVHNPVKVVRHMFEFCGLEVHAQTYNFISDKEKHHTDAYSVYKNKSSLNKWVQELNSDIAQAILYDINKSSLNRYL